MSVTTASATISIASTPAATLKAEKSAETPITTPASATSATSPAAGTALLPQHSKETLTTAHTDPKGNKETVAQSSAKILSGHSKSVNSLLWDPKSKRLISGSTDASIRKWDIQTGVSTLVPTGHKERIECLALSPDGTFFASGSSDKTVCIHSNITSSLVKTLQIEGKVFCLAYHPKKPILAAAGTDKVIYLWNTITFELITLLEGHTNHVFSLDFSSEANILISSSQDKTVRLWDLDSKKSKAIAGVSTASVEKVIFSPNGKLIAYGGGDHRVHLLDINQIEAPRTLSGHAGRIKTIAFSQNGKLLFTGGRDCTVHVWDLETNQSVTSLSGFNDTINSICLVEDEQQLNLITASGSHISSQMVSLTPHLDPQLLEKFQKLEQVTEQLKQIEDLKKKLEDSVKAQSLFTEKQIAEQIAMFHSIQQKGVFDKSVMDGMQQVWKQFESHVVKKTLVVVEEELDKVKKQNEEVETRLLSLEKVAQDTPELQQKVATIEQDLKPLRIEYEERQKVLQMQSYILQHQQLGTFYRRLQVKLNQIFTAFLAIGSGQIQRGDNTTTVVKILEIPLNLFSLGVGSMIMEGLDAIRNRREVKKIKEITEKYLISIRESERLVEEVARGLCLRYEDQIRKLSLPGQESWGDALTFSKSANGGTEILADCAIARMIDALSNHSIKPTHEMAQQLMDAVFTSAKAENTILAGITSVDVPTAHNKVWKDRDIFQGPGIKVQRGDIVEYFIGKGSYCNKPEIFHYRWGTMAEVTALNLQKQSKTDPVHRTSVYKYAHIYNTKLITQSQQDVKAKQELHNKNLHVGGEGFSNPISIVTSEEELSALKQKYSALEDEIRVMKAQMEFQQQALDTQKKLIDSLMVLQSNTAVVPAANGTTVATVTADVAAPSFTPAANATLNKGPVPIPVAATVPLFTNQDKNLSLG